MVIEEEKKITFGCLSLIIETSIAYPDPFLPNPDPAERSGSAKHIVQFHEPNLLNLDSEKKQL